LVNFGPEVSRQEQIVKDFGDAHLVDRLRVCSLGDRHVGYTPVGITGVLVSTIKGVSYKLGVDWRSDVYVKSVNMNCTRYMSVNYSAPVGERSIAISLSVCPRAYLWDH